MYYDDIRLERPITFGEGCFPREEHEIHVHDSLEVGLVLEHEVSYRFGNQTYIGKPGDVFVCRPFEPHWGFSLGEHITRWNCLLFVPSVARFIPGGYRLLIPFYTGWLPSPLIPAECPQAKAIARSFERASESRGKPEELREAEQFLCLLDILLQIYDYCSSLDQEAASIQHVQEIILAVNYLLRHFTEDVSMDYLIRLSGQKRTRFFENFQLFTGVSPHQFLLRLRIRHAMDALLLHPEHSILQISEDSGFQSLRTFNKQFKSYSGLTPGEYRNKFTR